VKVLDTFNTNVAVGNLLLTVGKLQLPVLPLIF